MILMVNSNWEPLRNITWQDAITKILGGKCVPASNKIVKIVRTSSNLVFNIPNIIQLVGYVRVPFMRKGWTPYGVKLRDDWTCGYCGLTIGDMQEGSVLSKSSFTIDHIIPKSKGGADRDWTNTICACFICNNKKGNTLLENINMQLLWEPKEPLVRDSYIDMIKKSLQDE